jgi:hypothetical protein
MQVPTESLKLRRDQNRIDVVHLLRGVPPPSPGSPDGDVSVSDFVQRTAAPRGPIDVRN